MLKLFNDIKMYTDTDIERANAALKRFMGGPINNDCRDSSGWGAINNVIENRNESRKSLKRSYITDTVIRQSRYCACAFSGSIFQQVDFLDTELEDNNFTYCVFHDCTFSFSGDVKPFSGSNFSQSEFVNCKFCNVTFRSSTVGECTFINCSFENCDFKSVTLENTIFSVCEFNHVNMRSLNLEYVIFKSSLFHGVTFPLYQFPFVIGAKEILSQEDSDIQFCANGIEIERDEYIKLLQHLLIYFSEKYNLFAVANIHLMLADNDAAFRNLILGIQLAIHDRDFRMIYHFCRLGKTYSLINPHTARDILNEMDDSIMAFNRVQCLDTQNSAAAEHALVCTEQARRLLLYDASEKQVLNFEIATKIPVSNTKKINAMQNELQRVIDQYGSDSDIKYIEVRHNSPITFFVQFAVAHPEVVFEVSVALFHAIKNLGKWIYRRCKRRQDKNFIIKEIRKKYGNDIDIHGSEWVGLLKEEIKNLLLETQIEIYEKKKGNVHKHIASVTQKIMGLIDSKFPDPNGFLIMTTRKKSV